MARSEERLLQDNLNEIEKSAVASTEKDIEYIILEREANSAKDLYRTLLGAVKEVNINTNNVSNNVVYVHEMATIPTSPIKPDKKFNLLMGLVLGIILGAGFAFGREYMDQTIRHAEDVKKSTGLPVLSTVPLFTSQNDGEARPLLSIINNPKSLFSESLLTLRTHLKIKLPQETPLTILVTSSGPREGKTMISSNLALCMAMDGKKTILIDSDLHRPSIHKMFSKDKNKGLFDLLVDALNPQWSEVELASMSLGDILHMIRLKHWSGTVRINWDSLDSPLTISYKEGNTIGSNISEWKDRFSIPMGFPPPHDLSFSIDESEIADYDSPRESGKQALDFVSKYPRICESAFFGDMLIEHFVKKSDLENLHILTAGTNPKNPSEIMGSEQMKMLLHVLKERYDRIIIDSPPAWPLADVSAISPLIDTVLWVCRAGEVPKKMFHNTIEQIKQVQPDILGVILNAVDLHRDRYYYYGYPYYSYRYYRSKYYHEYYYGKSEEEKKNEESSPPVPR
jgi:Mrp family chromosome partitioning ATPase